MKIETDWREPAHLAVRLHDDLVGVYSLIREKYQEEIDKAFDRVSRQIGFVVTTTVPVVLEVGDKGAVKHISMGAEHLQDTLFDKELSGVLGRLSKDQLPVASAGTYNLYLLWFDALKLKLRTDWVEPAHFHKGRFVAKARSELVVPEVMEPVHWFDPGAVIAVEEAVQISVIDEVYPELRLMDRVGSYREYLRK